MVASELRRCIVAVTLLLVAQSAFAAFSVTTDSDADDAGDGTCSLREAIIAVNTQADYHECTSATSGDANISFAIPPNAGELHTIALNTALPTITRFIGIDATTQAGTQCAPVPSLRVQVTNPSSLAVDGLVFDTGSELSTVMGLAISGFVGNAGIRITSNNVQIGCVIAGTDAAGTAAQPNYYGVYIDGQTTSVGIANAVVWLPNLISGNTYANVFVDAGGGNSVIAGNFIGVDSSGLTPLASGFGVYALDVSGLRIGYSAGSGASPTHQRNVIAIASPPATTAIDVEFDHTADGVAAGNYIGVGSDGMTAIAIGTGVDISVFDATNLLIGCDGNTPAESCRNLIANPTGVAIEVIEGSSGTAIVGNFIGLTADAITPFTGNTNAIGIELSGADALVARNFISAGGPGSGILLSPNGANTTPVFLNQTAAGNGGTILDSSDNCLHGSGHGVAVNAASNPTVLSTDFIDNWWGAFDGPAPNGSGDAAASNVNYTPFLTAPSPLCGYDRIFADSFD